MSWRLFAGVLILELTSASSQTGQGISEPATQRGGPVRAAKVFRGHGLQVLSVAFCPRGQRLLSSANRIRLWDVTTGNQLLEFGQGHGTIPAIAVSPNGREIASAHADGKIRLWDLARRKMIRCFTGHAGPLTSICFSADGARLLSGSRDRTLRVWDARDGRELKVLKGHGSVVFAVACSPDGRYGLSGSGGRGRTGKRDNTVRLWDLTEGKELCKLCSLPGPDWISAVAFSPDGRLAAAGTMGGSVRVWRVKTKAQLKLLETDTTILTISFSNDGTRIISAGAPRPPVRPGGSKTVKLWDAGTGELLCEFQADSFGTGAAAFSPDGRHLATGGNDKVIRLWPLPDGRQATTSPRPGRASQPLGSAPSPMGPDSRDRSGE